MVAFFRGWRRKFGVLTLLMACVFAAGWVRSPRIEDMVNCYSGTPTTGVLYSVHGSLFVGWYTNESAYHKLSLPGWYTVNPQLEGRVFFLSGDLDWEWKWCGFGFGHWSPVEGGPDEFLFMIPYWSIVVPLILVSALLLLIKPRKSTPEKIAKPI